VAVDKLAPYVAQLGELFLKQMQQSHAADPAYSFLFPGDSPARSYYLTKLEECGGLGSGFNPSSAATATAAKESAPAPAAADSAAEDASGAASPFNHGWREFTEAATGRKYYANKKTGVTTWVKPAAVAAAEAAAAAPDSMRKGRLLAGWRECEVTKAGAVRCYYHNASTGVTQWHKPEAFAEAERAAKEDEGAAPEAAPEAPPPTAAATGDAGETTAPAAAATKPDVAEAPAAAPSGSDQPAAGAEPDGEGGEGGGSVKGAGDDEAGEAGDGGGGAKSKRARREARRKEREAEAERRRRGEVAPQRATAREDIAPLSVVTTAEAADGPAWVADGSAEPISPAEAEFAFKQMLRDVSQRHPLLLEMDWEVALRHFIVDRRYGAVKTLAQRKALFSEFQVRARPLRCGLALSLFPLVHQPIPQGGVPLVGDTSRSNLNHQPVPPPAAAPHLHLNFGRIRRSMPVDFPSFFGPPLNPRLIPPSLR
jgi:hypothetical protein